MRLIFLRIKQKVNDDVSTRTRFKGSQLYQNVDANTKSNLQGIWNKSLQGLLIPFHTVIPIKYPGRSTDEDLQLGECRVNNAGLK